MEIRILEGVCLVVTEINALDVRCKRQPDYIVQDTKPEKTDELSEIEFFMQP